MKTSIERFESDAAALIADPLAQARAAAQSGRRVIGYIDANAPIELIFAANAVPVRLRGMTAAGVNHADEFLESSFTPEIRSIAEAWLTHQLDFLDAVVIPRGNDSAQRLYYYVSELKRWQRLQGPTPLLFDVATINRASSFEHTLASTHRLATELRADLSQLKTALNRTQRRQALLDQLQSLTEAPVPLRSSAAWQAARAGEFNWEEDFDEALEQWLPEAPLNANAKRIVFVGNAPPNDRLHRTIESAGGQVVRNLCEASFETRSGLDDLMSLLAGRCHFSRTVVQSMAQSPAWVLDQTRNVRAHGVVSWLIEEDEALPWEIAGQIRRLKEAGIPTLSLTRQQWHADAATLEAIASFVRQLNTPRSVAS